MAPTTDRTKPRRMTGARTCQYVLHVGKEITIRILVSLGILYRKVPKRILTASELRWYHAFLGCGTASAVRSVKREMPKKITGLGSLKQEY